MRLLSLSMLCLSCSAVAQWASVTSPTKANLYSVHAADAFAWISGSDGTVLRSTDKGVTFTACSTPKGAEHTVLRSIQGIDENTAVVMTSGKGEASVLYRTGDGCRTWKKVFVNPEVQSSFDSLRRVTSKQIYLLSEPVAGKFVLYLSQDGGSEWFISDDPGLDAVPDETASGSTLLAQGPFLYFGTASPHAPFVHYTSPICPDTQTTSCPVGWNKTEVNTGSTVGVGIHALAVQAQVSGDGKVRFTLAAVGGSTKDLSIPFAATSAGGSQWASALSPTHGDRTAAMIDQATQTLIAVGANGTDISKDYGKHWEVSKGDATLGWNALSLPLAVGNDGRIGMLTSHDLR